MGLAATLLVASLAMGALSETTVVQATAPPADIYNGVRPLTFDRAPVASAPIAILCGRLLTMADSNEIFDPGMILLRNGSIEYVGKPIDVPADYEVIDLGDAWVTPGFVDLHTHIHTGGWGDINEMLMPTNEPFSTRSTIVPSNPNVRRACSAGVTTLFGIPGSGTSISGFGVLYKSKTQGSYEEIVLQDPGGMKVAQTHNPERRAGDIGATRAGLSWLLEEVNDRAIEARDANRFDPALNNLARIQAKELPVLIHCAGNDGVASTVRMWKGKYDTKCILSHGSFDGWHAAEYVAAMGVPVNHGPRTYNISFGYKEGRFVNTSKAYTDAGVPNFSLTTDSGVIPQEEFFLQATMSAHFGSDPYQMLQALTINPAKSFGIEDSVGSLEVGKNADVVIWSGDPLDPRTAALMVLIDGAIQYNQANDGQWF
jgi:imidazolonepropionase-like amidohydrolase